MTFHSDKTFREKPFIAQPAEKFPESSQVEELKLGSDVIPRDLGRSRLVEASKEEESEC